jgi:hypothetical protein
MESHFPGNQKLIAVCIAVVRSHNYQLKLIPPVAAPAPLPPPAEPKNRIVLLSGICGGACRK